MARKPQPDAMAAHFMEDLAESQRQMMQVWWKGLSDRNTQLPWSDFFQAYLKASDQAVKTALEQQAKWAHQCLQAIAPDNGQTGSAMKKWRNDMDKAVQEWTHAERQCWEACMANFSKQNGGALSAKAMQSFWQAYAHTAQAMLAMPSVLATEALTQSTEANAEEALDSSAGSN